TEAGTGTGKSLAYLLPAAAWALQNGERTVIATATINLQEQLVTKDLPLVRDLVGESLTWALVKGRGNYVSIRRARLAPEEATSRYAARRRTGRRPPCCRRPHVWYWTKRTTSRTRPPRTWARRSPAARSRGCSRAWSAAARASCLP